jgi:hypothetical protein
MTAQQLPKLSLAERFKAAKTGFVSVTQKMKTPELLGAIERKLSDLTLSIYLPQDREAWESDLTRYLEQYDALIIVTDDSREISQGQLRELTAAKRAGRLLIVFNSSTGRWERFGGWERSRQDGKSIARLKEWQPKPGAATAAEAA